MTSQQMIEIFNTFPNCFEIASIWNGVLRYWGWLIIKLITSITGFFEESMQKIYSLNGFFNSNTVNSFIDKFKPLIFCALTASIIYIGYKLIIDREFKGERLIQNILLSTSIILVLPALMVELNNFTSSAIKELNNNYETTNAQKLVLSNLSDLRYLQAINFELPNKDDSSKDEGYEKKLNKLDSKQLFKIDINQEIKKSYGEKEIFKNKLDIDENSKETVVKLDSGFLGIGKEQYYRFNYSFIGIAIPLLCTVLTYILTSLKVVRLVFELGLVKILAIFYAFGDIANGRKIREILQHLLSTFVIIFATALLLHLYSGFIAWIDTKSLNLYVKLMFIIGSSWAVIDGPNILERIFGIDSGVKSGWGVFMSIKEGASALNSLAKGASNLGKGIGKALSSDTAKTVGEKALAGATAGAKFGADAGSKGLASVAGGLAGLAKGVPLEEEGNNINKDTQNKSGDNIPSSENSTLDKQSDINNETSSNGNMDNSYGEKSSLDSTDPLENQCNTGDKVSNNSQIDSLENQSSMLNENTNPSTLNDNDLGSSNENINKSINSDESISNTKSENLESQSYNSNSDINDSIEKSNDNKLNDTPNLENEEPKHYGDILDNKIKEGKEAFSEGKEKLIKGFNEGKSSIKKSMENAPENIKNKTNDFLNNTNTGKTFKRHYNLGANTNIALKNKLNKKGKK
ncbi:hypothetical protein WS9_014115 [Paraclostridium sordellii 8483]|uniref:pLS20_p028 family conjugation system transmembrane protein n=1 Tax=Paraclostridium sordellii TaxID=1505 RepID=UPI00030CB7CD|nr:hypothetical protein [Paeniclostridium sordellii]TAN64456.1 hypothetical protein WS9_014115 [Paeniclostridium sordellii 8483]